LDGRRERGYTFHLAAVDAGFTAVVVFSNKATKPKGTSGKGRSSLIQRGGRGDEKDKEFEKKTPELFADVRRALQGAWKLPVP
jgi:hypothetical protein